MALDTSLLSLVVHKRVAAGDSLEAIAESYGRNSLSGELVVSVAAIQQYLFKVNSDGTTRQEPTKHINAELVRARLLSGEPFEEISSGLKITPERLRGFLKNEALRAAVKTVKLGTSVKGATEIHGIAVHKIERAISEGI